MTVWQNIKGTVIAIHLVAIVLKALPAPEGAMAKKDWAHPTVQAEFRNWSATLQQVGIDIPPPELEKHLWFLANRVTSVRNTALKPFRPYYRYVGADQNWRLFVAPHMYPSTLEIDVLEEAEWGAVYRVHKPDQWMEHLIEQGRFRPAIFRYSWGRYKKQYNQFAMYLTERATQDFPNATQIRFRWWRYPLPSHAEILAGQDIMGSHHTTLVYPLVSTEDKP
jgi:hypothetical protein